jgi:hypothetical protein
MGPTESPIMTGGRAPRAGEGVNKTTLKELSSTDSEL